MSELKTYTVCLEVASRIIAKSEEEAKDQLFHQVRIHLPKSIVPMERSMTVDEVK